MLSAEEQRELERCCRLYERGILTLQEVVCRLGAVARPHNLHWVVAGLTPALAEPLRAQVSSYRPVRAVGYWCPTNHSPSGPAFRPPAEAELPDPRRLVGPDRDTADRERIVAYLRAGHVYAQWRGLSYCRFRCGIESGLMGSRCLTDGAWVWPEGLAHYVEAHSVRLPVEFVSSMEAMDWAMPCADNTTCYETQGEPDYEFWVTWGRTTSMAETA
jgi:hypothetical protein